jgi:Flp pilus assembly protein TadD
LLLASDHQADAIRELRTAVELEPDSAASHYFLGTGLLDVNQLPAALAEFREAVRLEPSAEHHYALAACLMNMGNDREALAEIQIATRLDPAKQLYHAREQELMRLMRAGNAAQ